LQGVHKALLDALYQAEIFGFVRAILIGNVPEAERR
jgi:hypothetical protein